MPTEINEYAFSGSLCRIREFETSDGPRFCLTIFSLSDYKHLHFPHSEYKWLIDKIHACLSPNQAQFHVTDNSDISSILKQITFEGDFKVKYEGCSLIIGALTAIGLGNTSPFSDLQHVVNKKRLACNIKWDICTCKAYPVFIRLREFEASAQRLFTLSSNNIKFST